MGRSAQLPGVAGTQSGMGRVSAVLANPPMFNDSVDDLEVHDGKAYVVGYFDRVSQERMGYGIPVDKVTGQPVQGFDPIDGHVENVVEDGIGGWYINGYFTRVGTTDRAGFSHILPNGKLDPNWNLSVQSGEFGEMAYFNGKLYVEVVSYPSENISKVELHCYNTATRKLEKNWTLYEGDWDSYPYISSIKATTGRVYIGGDFTSLNGQPHNNIAALDTASGNILDSFKAGTDGIVEEIVVTKDAVIVGGRFDKANNTERGAVAAFSPINGALLPLDPRLGSSGNSAPEVYALDLIGDTLYMGGPFYKIGDQEVRGFAGLNLKTGLPVVLDLGDCGYVTNMGVGGNTIYVGFSGECEVQGQARQWYGALNTNGVLTPWDPKGNSHTRNIVSGSQAVFLVVDSGFLGGIKRQGFAVFDINTGRLLEDFAPVSNGNSLLLDGTILYVGGGHQFSAIDLVTKSVRALPEVGGSISDMVKKGDVIYLGGDFNSVGGEPRANLAAINTSGELLSWAPQVKVTETGRITDMAVKDDQIIVVGGFTSVNDQPRKDVAAISINGTLVDWAPVFDGRVYDMSVDESSVYVGGAFISVDIGGQHSERGGFAEFVGSGLTLSDRDPRFTYDGLFPGEVSGLSTYNGVIYVGGFFNQVGNTATKGTAALRKSDGVLVPWNADLGDSPWLPVIKVVEDRVYIGGDITTANGQIQGGLAVVGLASPALAPPPAPTKFVVPQRSSTTLSLQWDPSAGATSYSVKITSPLTLVKENITTAFTQLDSLTPNTQYEVGVKACNAVGCSAYATAETFTWAAVPGLSTTSVRGTSIGLKIDPNGNPKGTIYEFQQVNSPDGFIIKSGTSDVAESVIDHLNPDTSYFFRVYAKNLDGSLIGPSSVLTVKTGLIANLLTKSVDRVSSTNIGVSWSIDPPGSSFMLAASTRSSNPLDSFVSVQKVVEPKGMLTDLTPNTRYNLFVLPCDEDRCHDYVDLGSMTTLANIPSLMVVKSGQNNPALRIQPNGNPAGTFYVVEKSEDGGMTFVAMYVGMDREVDLSDLPLGKMFHFRVTAKNFDGLFTSSSEVIPYESSHHSIEQTRAYPVPFHSGSGTKFLTFDSFPPDSTIDIYNLNGEQIKTITPSANSYQWDVRNQEGEDVASGVYYVRVSGSGGDKTFKIVVQR